MDKEHLIDELIQLEKIYTSSVSTTQAKEAAKAQLEQIISTESHRFQNPADFLVFLSELDDKILEKIS